MTVTVRLGTELEKKLTELSRKRSCTKSEIIKESLGKYLEQKWEPASSYELGKDLFGREGSGIKNLSTNRQILKQKIREKVFGRRRAPDRTI